jgi:hypothetical protein
MSDETIKPHMSIGDQILVDKLASGHADISDLGRVVAKTYQQTDNQTKILDDHSEKLAELTSRVNDIVPTVNTLSKSHARGKWFARTCLGILTFCGIGTFTALYDSGAKLVWVANLTEDKISEIARTETEKLSQKEKQDVDYLNHRLDLTEVEIKTKK